MDYKLVSFNLLIFAKKSRGNQKVIHLPSGKHSRSERK